jgi:hypothetical protein
MDNFSAIAAGLQIVPVKRPLEGLYEEEGCNVARNENIHIMAMQVRACI